MAKRKRDRKRIDTTRDEPVGGALADRLSALGFKRSEPAVVEAVDSPTRPADLGGKLVLRKERKGRGGRTVTALSGVAGDGEALTELARRLQRALGCGATVEDGTIVLQGDLRERARGQLTAWGARRVVLGN